MEQRLTIKQYMERPEVVESRSTILRQINDGLLRAEKRFGRGPWYIIIEETTGDPKVDEILLKRGMV